MEKMGEPKVLHCGHNLCSTCVTGGQEVWVMVGAEQWSSIECPLCRQVTQRRGGSNPLATNYELKSESCYHLIPSQHCNES